MSNEAKPNGATEAPLISAEELDALKKKAAERDQYLDIAQRARAEFENYQKRNQQEREVERKYAYTPIVYDLFKVIDNLDRAMAAAQQAGETGPLVEGVNMVHTQFLEMLRRHSITRIEAQGKPFDPNLHQAVMQRPSDVAEPNTILQ